MEHSLPGSFVRGILQARMLEWVAILFSRGSSQPTYQTWIFCIADRFFTIWATREVHEGPNFSIFFFIKFLLLSDLLVIAVLVSVKSYLIVVLICIFQMTDDIDHYFMGLFMWFYIFFGEMSIYILCNWSVYPVIIDIQTLLVYSRCKALIKHLIYKYFTSSYELFFHFLDVLWYSTDFNFDGVQFIFFSCSHIKEVFVTSLVVQGLRLWAPNAGGLGLISDQGTRSHMLQLKILNASAKTQCNQINTWFFKKKSLPTVVSSKSFKLLNGDLLWVKFCV